MKIEFDRYEITRTMRGYSNDLLSAFNGYTATDAATKQNAISRAQSMLADIVYINKIADLIRSQVVEAQRRLDTGK